MIIYYDFILLKCFSSWDRVCCGPGQPSTSYVAHDDFDILILKLCPPVCWGDVCVPPSSVYMLQRMKPKVLRMLGKQSIKWAISAATFEGFVQQLCFSYYSLSIPPYKWNLFYSWDFSPSSLLLDEVVPPRLK